MEVHVYAYRDSLFMRIERYHEKIVQMLNECESCLSI